ncbi:MAG: hypothetical protein R3B13_24700 [Polyangiaceae bacterium]
MLKLDEFESVFKAAAKERLEYEELAFRSALVVTDLDAEGARLYARDVKQFLRALGDELQCDVLSDQDFDNVGEVLEHVERRQPDLLVAFRNLKGRAKHFPFSLGAHVDVLAQATKTPILLLPLPTAESRLPESCSDTDSVMVLTDHLTGDSRLVNTGAAFTAKGGALTLTHLEDDAVFGRYMATIAKIPSIDTDNASEQIRKRLLKDPADYVLSCKQALAVARPDLEIHGVIEMGHRVAQCQRLSEAHDVDLLVINTKDDEQLAMHGLAYPLAVELRQLPLLLL